MGMPFSDSTGLTGIYELFQRMTKTNPTSYPISIFSQDCNNAFADLMVKILMAAQKWQGDDTNQTDYPIITLNLVAGQQDYPFVLDGSTVPNQILNINRVERQSAGGTWDVLTPYDQDGEPESLTQRALTQGIPNRFDELANAVWLDPVPNYNLANGLKIYFGRTPVYFLATDTTKTPGIPDFLHRYLALKPAYDYCLINIPSLANGYMNQINDLEALMMQYYFFRNKNERKNMRPMGHNTK